MTTVTIDDELATRLRALRDGGDDFNRVVAEALAETVRRWEWEAAGRATCPTRRSLTREAAHSMAGPKTCRS